MFAVLDAQAICLGVHRFRRVFCFVLHIQIVIRYVYIHIETIMTRITKQKGEFTIMNRFELQNKVKEVLDNAPNMSAREWENAYLELYNECDYRMTLSECMDEQIVAVYGEDALADLADKAAQAYMEIQDIENDATVEDLTPEQEQLLNDLF